MINDTIIAGLNNPDCAFYVGTFFGQWSMVKMILYLGGLYILVRGLEKLALEPVIDRWKKKKGGRR